MYFSFPLEITVNKPAAEVWARVGKYCDIGEWFQLPCTIISGKDGEFGGVSVVGGVIGGKVGDDRFEGEAVFGDVQMIGFDLSTAALLPFFLDPVFQRESGTAVDHDVAELIVALHADVLQDFGAFPVVEGEGVGGDAVGERLPGGEVLEL